MYYNEAIPWLVEIKVPPQAEKTRLIQELLTSLAISLDGFFFTLSDSVKLKKVYHMSSTTEVDQNECITLSN